MPELRHEEGFYQSRDHLRLYWQSMRPRNEVEERAHVLVVHGYGDHSGRYRALLDRFASEGLATHAFDYRGHGQSDGRRGHCDMFDHFLDDLELYLATVKKRAGSKKIFIFSHSHGGLVTATWALRRSTEGISGLVFSAPFFRLAFKPPPVKVLAAKVLERVVPFFPFGNELKVEQLSKDPEWQKATERDPLYGHLTTPRWFAEATRTQLEVLRRAGDIRLPALVLQGEKDPIADPAATREFFDRLGSPDKTWKQYDGFLHELINEVGKERVYDDVLAWVNQHV